MDFTYLADLARELAPPAEGFSSRLVYRDEQLKAMLFAFAAGAELAEHSAPLPAALQILQGEGTLTLGAETRHAAAGTWVHMPARLPHGIRAETPLVMLLLLLK
jgi:quercetin dioxygenase-like cupin family protein